MNDTYLTWAMFGALFLTLNLKTIFKFVKKVLKWFSYDTASPSLSEYSPTGNGNLFHGRITIEDTGIKDKEYAGTINIE